MRNQIQKRRLKKATTLMELLIALAVIVVILSVVAPQIKAIRNSWASKIANSELIQNGSAIVDHITSQLAASNRITAVSEPQDNTGYIEFADNNSNILRYELGDDGYINFGPAGNLSPIAGPVNTLQFTCYDAYDIDSPTTEPAYIRCVKVATAVPAASELTRDQAFEAVAYLRTNYQDDVPAIAVSGDIDVLDASAINGDVGVGPGGTINVSGGQINGTQQTFSEPIDFPIFTEPDLGASIGNLTYSGTTNTISTNVHCDNFNINNATVQISGDVTMVIDGQVNFDNGTQLNLLPGATLTLFTKDLVVVDNTAQVNCNTADPGRLAINHIGSADLQCADGGEIYASIVAPDAMLHVDHFGTFHGSFMGQSLLADNNATITPVHTSGSRPIRP